MRKTILTVATVAVAAVSARAQAQAVQAPAGQAYTIISNAPATAINTVTYQWYRNNSLIPDATGANYTVPAAYAYGDNVQFYRLARTTDCTGEVEKPSNIVTITFTGYIIPEGCSLIIGGTCWAATNLDALRTFATRADMYTRYYQWNRLTAYPAEDPLDSAWNSVVNESEMWTVNPCPNGWRIPSQEEYQQLVSSGSTWVAANSGRGNAVAGRFYGYLNSSCNLPGNMSGCVFLPACGYRLNSNGALGGKGTNADYWSITSYNLADGYDLNFTTSTSIVGHHSKGFGFSIRCVK